MNRAARKQTLFEAPGDYAAFEQVLAEAADRVPMRLLCYAVMPTHWHLVVWPHGNADLSRFMHWVTMTHAQRWQLAHGGTGTGAVYQGRYKAIPVQCDPHFLRLCRYVERNPLRAGLVSRAEQWHWSSASQLPRRPDRPALHDWPLPRPDDWSVRVNSPESRRDLLILRHAVSNSSPLGGHSWRREVVTQLGWRAGLRRRGRPPGKRTRAVASGPGVAVGLG